MAFSSLYNKISLYLFKLHCYSIADNTVSYIHYSHSLCVFPPWHFAQMPKLHTKSFVLSLDLPKAIPLDPHQAQGFPDMLILLSSALLDVEGKGT